MYKEVEIDCSNVPSNDRVMVTKQIPYFHRELSKRAFILDVVLDFSSDDVLLGTLLGLLKSRCETDPLID